MGPVGLLSGRSSAARLRRRGRGVSRGGRGDSSSGGSSSGGGGQGTQPASQPAGQRAGCPGAGGSPVDSCCLLADAAGARCLPGSAGPPGCSDASAARRGGAGGQRHGAAGAGVQGQRAGPAPGGRVRGHRSIAAMRARSGRATRARTGGSPALNLRERRAATLANADVRGTMRTACRPPARSVAAIIAQGWAGGALSRRSREGAAHAANQRSRGSWARIDSTPPALGRRGGPCGSGRARDMCERQLRRRGRASRWRRAGGVLVPSADACVRRRAAGRASAFKSKPTPYNAFGPRRGSAVARRAHPAPARPLAPDRPRAALSTRAACLRCLARARVACRVSVVDFWPSHRFAAAAARALSTRALAH